RARTEELDAVDAVLSRPVDPATGLARIVDVSVVPAASRRLIVHDPRCDDLVTLTTPFVLDGRGVVGEADSPHGRDAVAEPELVGVRTRGVALFGMRVHVDEPRHDPHAGRIDLVVG